jgi:hypothetical protein
MLGAMNYAPGAWHDFGATGGGLAGALTGLLFVALPIKGPALDASLALRSRAAQTLVLFVTPAIAGIVLVAPQPRAAIGAELLMLAAVSGVSLLVLDRRPGTIARTSWPGTSSGLPPTRSSPCSPAWPG